MLIHKRDWRKPTKFGKSKTIPGQSLIPADLMKRHLAGTLPDIDQSAKYEYHYDEDGNQIGEPIPLEMHELHKMAVVIRKRQYEEQLKAKEEQAKRFRQQVIDEYVKEQASKGLEPKPVPPIKKSVPRKKES